MLGKFAIAAAVVAVASAVDENKPSEFCGEGWLCSPTKREVCGQSADGNTLTTRNNKCEAVCYGETVEREGACLADLQKRFEECSKFKDQETACGAKDGCFFTPNYRQKEAEGYYGDYFVPDDIANLQNCYEIGGGMNKTACNIAVDDDGARTCMWESYSSAATGGAGGYGDMGQCKEFNKCENAGLKGKIGCELEDGCFYQESQGNCVEPDFSLIPLGTYPTNKTSCESFEGTWEVYAQCMDGSSPGGLPGGGPGAGGDDLSQEEPEDVSGTTMWQQACDTIIKTECLSVEHEGKDAVEGDKGCTWTEGLAQGFCAPAAEDGGDADAQTLCFGISDNTEESDTWRENNCNAEDTCKWELTAAMGMCSPRDLCDKNNENEAACEAAGCKFFARNTDFQAADSQQCFSNFGSEEYAGPDIDFEDNDECAKIESAANCNTKKNEVTGKDLCVYKQTSSGECLVDGSDSEFCQCYTEDCESSEDTDNFSFDKAQCNGVTKDDNGKSCSFDEGKGYGSCMKRQCFDNPTETLCDDAEGCAWKTDYDGYCASEQEQSSLDNDMITGGSDEETAQGEQCYSYSPPDKISQCTAENGCATQSYKVSACDGAEGAEDSVNENCQSYAFSRAECEAQKCDFSVKDIVSCDSAVSCRRGDEDLGGGEEACKAIVDSNDKPLCQWEAISGSDDVTGYCQQRVDGQGDSETFFVNGTCSLDQERRGDEGAASYGSYSSYGSYGTTGSYDSAGYYDYNTAPEVYNEYGCQGVNTSDAADAATCDKLRDDSGYKMCTMGSTEAEPMQCRHASRLEEYTGDYTPTDGEEEQQEYEPKVVDCYLGDTFSKTDCTDIEKIDGLGCYFEEMMCKCLNPENLPVDDVGGSYGGYNGGGAYNGGGSYGGEYSQSYSSYGGGGYNGDGGNTPQTEYQCAAAPANATCTWAAAGSCSCDTQPTDDNVNTYLWDKAQCNAAENDVYDCTWYGLESCVAEVDLCDKATSEDECGKVRGANGKSITCEYKAPVMDYTCRPAVVTDDERCARFSNSNECDQQDGCRMQESMDQAEEYLEDLLEGSGFSNGTWGGGGDGLGVEIFQACYTLEQKGLCDGAVGLIGNVEVKKCAWAQNVYTSCVPVDPENDAAFDCYNKGDDEAGCTDEGGDLEGLCKFETTTETQCIPFDACSVRAQNKTFCTALEGCAFAGEDAMEAGFCQPQGLSNEGEGEASAGDGTGPQDAPGGPDDEAGYECAGKLKPDCGGECEWVKFEGTEMDVDPDAVCFADFSEDSNNGGASPDQGGDAPGGGSDDMDNVDVGCFSRASNKTFCEEQTKGYCVSSTLEDSPSDDECSMENKETACIRKSCVFKTAPTCQYYAVSQSRSCIPQSADADNDKWDECGAQADDSEQCAGTSGCEVEATTYPAQCVPNMGAGEGFGDGPLASGAGPNVDVDGDGVDVGTDNGFFEMDAETCYRDPFACCQNNYDAASCSGRKDAAGDSMCAFIKGDDYSYCGGALCNASLTLGATAITCGQISGCQWVSETGQDWCTFVDKCQGKNQTSCDAVDVCQYGYGSDNDIPDGDGGTGDAYNSGGRCDVKDSSATDTEDCVLQVASGDCEQKDSCKWFSDADSMGDMQESGFCGPEGPEPCDDTVGSRAWNSTACEEAKECKWSKGIGAGAGGASEGYDTNCHRKEGNGGDADATFSGASDGLTLGGYDGDGGCAAHDTLQECRRPLDKNGKAECSWVVAQVEGNDFSFCQPYNKCGVSTKKECQENECQWSEKFDFNKGGTEGVCGHPPSTFDESGNYTCLPDFGGGYNTGGYAGSYTGDYAGGDAYEGTFFGYDFEFVETTTTTRTTITTTKTTRTYTTTTASTTTVTHKTEQATVAEGEVIVIDENGNEQTQDEDELTGGSDFVDEKVYALDITFGNNFYTQLDEIQKSDVETQVQLVFQARLRKFDIYEGKFKSASAYGVIDNRQRRAGNHGILKVRVEFYGGLLLSDLEKIQNDIIKVPLSFSVDRKQGLYKSSYIVLTNMADVPMTYPVGQSAADIAKDLQDQLDALEDDEPRNDLSAAELAAKQKADKEEKDRLQELKEQALQAEKCVDSDGNTLTAAQCERQKEEKAEELAKKAEEDAACDAVCKAEKAAAAEAAGAKEVALKAYSACLAQKDPNDPTKYVSMESCSAEKAAYDVASKSFADKKEKTPEQLAQEKAKAEQDAEVQAKADDEGKKKSTAIAIGVIVGCLALIGVAFIFYIKNHHAFDDVYGTAGMASYSNPVYGGAAPAGADGGYLGAGASQEYPKSGAKKKGGLVRQESMC